MTSSTTPSQSWATPETGPAPFFAFRHRRGLVAVVGGNFVDFAAFSAGFLRFVRVLCGMSSDERKAFLQFTTGCSTLPPGGLANLHPRLTIVRKVSGKNVPPAGGNSKARRRPQVDATDSSYPSVNTCVHYLKLPEYSSEDIMRERLLAATMEKGFHLN